MLAWTNQMLSWLAITTLLFIVITLGSLLVSGALPVALGALVLCGYLGILVWARRQMHRGALNLASASVSSGLLCAGPIGAVLIPQAALLHILLPLLAVICALPYLDKHGFQRLLAAALLAFAGVVILSEVVPPWQELPFLPLALPLSVFGVGLIFCVLFWQYRYRLDTALTQMRDSQAALEQARDDLERQVETRTAALRERVAMEECLARIAQSFATAPAAAPAGPLVQALQMLGRFVHAECAQVFELAEDGATLRNTHTWHGADIALAAERMPDVPVAALPWWMERLKRYAPLHIRCVDELPPDAAAEQARLCPPGVQSILAVPLIVEQQVRGFVSFTTIRAPHAWIDANIVLLVLAGELVAQALERARATAAHARLIAILDATPDLVAISDSGGCLLYLNPAGRRLLGVQADADLAPIDATACYTAESYALFRQEALPAALRNGVWQGETTLVDRSGRRIPGSQVFIAHGAADGTVECFSTVIRDITRQKQMETALREREARFRLLAENAQDVIYRYRLAPVPAFEYISPAIRAITGYTPEEFYADPSIYTRLVHPDDQGLLQLHNLERARDPVILRWIDSNGAVIWIEQRTTVTYAADCNPLAIEGVARDITARIVAEEALRSRDKQYRLVVNSVREVIYQTDAQGRWIFLNPAWTEITGYAVSDSLGRFFLEFVYPDDRAESLAAFQPLLEHQREDVRHTMRYLASNGGIRWIEAHARLLTGADDAVLGVTGTLIDVTDRKRYEERIEHLAYHDTLTELANRRQFYRIAEATLTNLAPATPLTLLYLDLDRFKTVNDTMGHDAGDDLLVQVAGRLRASVRSNDLLARLGGDEFAMLLPYTDTSQAVSVARRLLDLLCRPFVVRGQTVHIGGSIGIAPTTVGSVSFGSLLTQADIAMYRAKIGGGGYLVYDPDIDTVVEERFHLELELRQALAEGELLLYYQPIYDLHTDEMVGVEALVRWSHPKRGLLLPDTFLGLAEERGLIRHLEDWVLHAALTQAAVWARAGQPRDVAINLTAHTLQDRHLVETMAAHLEATGAPAERVIIEVTERSALRDPVTAQRVLVGLRNLGLRIALDDFGSGYASLSSLQQLPVDMLKIDRSFTAGIGSEPRDEAVIRALLALGQGLRLTVVVEGVECGKQLTWLRNAGCDRVQGYLIGRPSSPMGVVPPLNPLIAR